MQMEDHWIDAPQGRLFARSWTPGGQYAKSKATFVLLHDSLGSVELWRDFPVSQAEATGRRVVAYDRLGFGRSDPYPGAIAADFVTSEATTSFPALEASLGLGELIPFGHSVGGGMAVAAAARLPGRCAAVVTMSAQAFVEDRTLAGIRAAKAAFSQPGQMKRLERYHGDKAQWVLDAWTETWQSSAFADWNLDSELKGVRCPLIALHGDRDEFGSARHPERIATMAAGPATAVIIEDCGHVPSRERPERVIQEVTGFLAHHLRTA